MPDPRVTSPSRKDLRSFGMLIGGVFGVVWLYRLLVHGDRLVPLLAVASALVALGALCPSALRYPYRVWMWVGRCTGAVMSRVLLAVCYFSILTPIAFVRRMVTRDPLELKFDRSVRSYFHDKRIQSRSQLEHMF